MGAPYGGCIDGDHRVVELLDLQPDAKAACGSDAGPQVAVITDHDGFQLVFLSTAGGDTQSPFYRC